MLLLPPVAWRQAHRQVFSQPQPALPLCLPSLAPPWAVLQVVSGDEGGTLVMWNVQSGRREGGFSLHSHPASSTTSAPTSPTASASLGAASAAAAAGVAPAHKLTAMAFDANQRRLLTATDGGTVAMWNFNSGAVLRRFRHREGGAEITAVAFVQRQQPAQQGVEAEGEQAAAEQADVGQMGAAQQPAEGASVDSSERYSELSEHGMMLSMAQQAQRRGSQRAPQQLHAAAGEQEDSGSSEDGGPSDLVLATGWSRHLCIWEEGEAPSISQYRRLAGHGADVLCMAPLGADVAATGG